MRSPALDGSVRIGISEEYVNSTLPKALGAFAAIHPGVEVTVRQETSMANSAALRGRRTRHRRRLRAGRTNPQRGSDGTQPFGRPPSSMVRICGKPLRSRPIPMRKAAGATTWPAQPDDPEYREPRCLCEPHERRAHRRRRFRPRHCAPVAKHHTPAAASLPRRMASASSICRMSCCGRDAGTVRRRWTRWRMQSAALSGHRARRKGKKVRSTTTDGEFTIPGTY